MRLNKIKKWKLIVIITILVSFSALFYSFVDNDFEVSKNLDIFATVVKQLNLNYVDPINSGDLMKTAIDEMLNTLDPYTNYIPESEAEDYRFMTTGQYGGIGARIAVRGEYTMIYEPYEGFPAQKNGLKAGDVLIEVNGKSVKGKTTAEVSDLLKGSPGSEVKVLYKRDGESKDIEKTIKREEIKIDNVPYFGLVDKGIGYIKLTGFTQNAGKEVKDAYLKLKENALNGIIIDLRENGGGLLNEAVNIVNIFVDKGQLVVSTKGKLETSNVFHRTIMPVTDADIPLVILVDEYSASASEIVTGAIQDLDRGVIIGQKTFGKGLVQNIVPLSYNAQMKVTVAKYYIPSGRCIQAIDYSHKDKDGVSKKMPDSLKTAFKTKNGRVVYDGGGIIPDIVIEDEVVSNIAVSLMNKQLIFDFATKYNREHPTISACKDFKLDDNLYNEFVKFISTKEYDYTTKSEKILKDLKDTAEKEKYFEAIKADYEALRHKMLHDKNSDLEKFKEELKILLRKEIITRYYYLKGRIETELISDKDIAKAKEILNNKETYKSILEGNKKK